MERNFQTGENGKVMEFGNFSIRAYVAEIRRRDRRRCWPFSEPMAAGEGEPVAPLQLEELECASDQNRHRASDVPDDETKATNALERGRHKDKEDNCRSSPDRNGNQGIVMEDDSATIPSCVDVAEGLSGRNLRRRRPQKFLSLSGILENLTGPCTGFHIYSNVVDSEHANEAGQQDESDNAPLRTLRRQKGAQITSGSGKSSASKKKKRKTLQVQEPGWCQIKRLKPGSDHNVHREKQYCKGFGAEVSQSSSLMLPEDKGDEFSPCCLGREENTSRMQKAEKTRTTSGESPGENEEIEIVKLLWTRFGTEEHPSGAAHGMKMVDTVQPTGGHATVQSRASSPTRAPDRNLGLEVHHHVSAPTMVSRQGKVPSSSIGENKQLSTSLFAKSVYYQMAAKITNRNKDAETPCACVQKKIRVSSTPANSVFSANTRKFTTKQLAEALASVQKDNYPYEVAKQKETCMPLKVTGLIPPASVSLMSQPRIEVPMVKAGVDRALQRGRGTLVCSINRNPVDFSEPDSTNEFMRGG